jgi:DNA-binding NtrC family response regulator
MKPLLVLLIDGDPDRRRDIGALLEAAGHRVTLRDDATIQDRSELGRYDLLIIDAALAAANSGALAEALDAAQAIPDSLNDAERRHLDRVLRHTAGNKRKAAHLLGISRSTLLNKVRKYGLER